MHFIAVLNRDGGTLRTMDLDAFCRHAVELFAAHGATLECRLVSGAELLPALQAAVAAPGSDALLAGGGDGTISAAAGICYRAGKPLAILPAGTMNLFARSLKLPLNLDGALQALAAGEIRSVDIATANGRPFIHQFAVGLHPRLVKLRETLPYHSRWGKMLASLRAIWQTLARPLKFDIQIDTDGQVQRRKAAAISVSNNLLEEGHVPYAEIVDAGVLGLYTVNPMRAPEMVRLVIGVLIGNWKQEQGVTEQQARRVVLSFPRRKSSAKAVIDGELVPLDARVELRSHPLALQVVVPRPAEAVEA